LQLGTLPLDTHGFGSGRARTSSPGITGQGTATVAAMTLIPCISH